MLIFQIVVHQIVLVVLHQVSYLIVKLILLIKAIYFFCIVNRGVSIREIMRRANHTANREMDSQSSSPMVTNASAVVGGESDNASSLPVVYWPPEYDPTSGDEDSMTGKYYQKFLYLFIKCLFFFFDYRIEFITFSQTIICQ